MTAVSRVHVHFYLCRAEEFYLEIDDYSKHKHCSNQVHEIGQILSVKRLPQSPDFVSSCGQEME